MPIGHENAIAWAQYQLAGGTKKILLFTAGYFVLIGAIAIVTSEVADVPRSTAMYNWTIGMLGLQVLFLLLLGSFKIGGAIRKDLTGGSAMIESHRLMPLTPRDAVVGYITGGAAPSLLIGVANFVLGALFSQAGNVTFDRWIVANLVLLTYAVFVWFFVAYSAFIAGGLVGAIMFFIVPMFTGPSAILLLPGTALLAGPLVGRGVFAMRPELTWVHAAAAMTQTAMALIFWAGATRKYVRSSQPALGVLLGVLVVALWTTVSLIAFIFAEEVRPSFVGRGDRADIVPQIIGTIVVLLLLSLVPLSNAARARSTWLVRSRSGDPTVGRKPISPLWIALFTAACAAGLSMMIDPEQEGPQSPLWYVSAEVAAASFAFLMALSYLLRWNYLAVPRGAMLAGIFLVITWLLPPIIDIVRATTRVPPIQDDPFGFATTLSPIGAIGFARDHPDANVYPGIACQAFLIVLTATLYYSSLRKFRGSGTS